MNDYIQTAENISESQLKTYLEEILGKVVFKEEKKVLLLPPDITRYYSRAGLITNILYGLLKDKFIVEIMPALGTHDRMTEEEIKYMFGNDVPLSAFIYHDFKEDVMTVGEIPGSFISEVSEGLMNEPVKVQINKRLMSGQYAAIISIGQVVPHEVAGMANHSKNIFVGCGGKDMISSTHMLGAFYGIERVLGISDSPVRKVFNYALDSFTRDINIFYILTAVGNKGKETTLSGIFAGYGKKVFYDAAKMSQDINITYLDKPLTKCVVYLEAEEYKSTWIGNKAIYRTRKAMAQGGTLYIIAPGVSKFGEDIGFDRLIRKYGYKGREYVIKKCGESPELRDNLSVAAHLIHGSSDEKFDIVYGVKKLSSDEINEVGFIYEECDSLIEKFNVKNLQPGYNNVNGEEIYYIDNPGLGLWTV